MTASGNSDTSGNVTSGAVESSGANAPPELRTTPGPEESDPDTAPPLPERTGPVRVDGVDEPSSDASEPEDPPDPVRSA